MNFENITSRSKSQTATYCVSPCICLSVCSGCHKMPQAGWVKQQKFIFAQIWRQEVQDEGAGKLGSWGEPSSWLVESGLPAVTSRGLSSLLAEREREALWWLFLLWGHRASWIRAPAFLPHLSLITSIKKHCLQIQSHRKLGLQQMNWGRRGQFGV